MSAYAQFTAYLNCRKQAAGQGIRRQEVVYLAYFAADLLSSITGPDTDSIDVDVFDQMHGQAHGALLPRGPRLGGARRADEVRPRQWRFAGLTAVPAHDDGARRTGRACAQQPNGPV